MTTWLPRWTIVWLALAFAVGACGGSGDDAATSPSDSSPTTVVETPIPTSTAPPEPTETPQPSPTPTSTSRPEPTPTPAPHRMTIDELLEQDGPLNIAHAGGDQAWPHSTMFAFKQAVLAGADVLEIDVQLSADGELVVHHDSTVDGTTNGTGLTIDFTLAELQSLDNGYWFAEQCWPCRELDDGAYIYRGVRTGERPPPEGYGPDDFRIVSLTELVTQFPTMPFDIEIKGEEPEALAVATALGAAIADLSLTDSAVVVAFDDAVVAAFEAAAPGVETSPGQEELTFWFLTDTPLRNRRIVQVPPFFDELEIVNAEFMAAANEAGVFVWVWPNDAATQENTNFYRELIDLGVDGIIAGRPEAMQSARG